MKIFSLQVLINSKNAQLRAFPDQLKNRGKLDVWWEDWGVEGNEIKDFLFCNTPTMCLEKIATELNDHFKGLSICEVKINKTEKEQSGNIDKMKYLPKVLPIFKNIYTDVEFELLPQSSVIYEKDEGGELYIDEIEGISEMRGSLIIPRIKEKGFFFSKDEVLKFDFFKPINSNFLLCTEKVKIFCEKQGYSNVVFLEVGDLI